MTELTEQLVPVTMAFYLVLFGGWVWSMLVVARESRRGPIALTSFNLLLAIFGLVTILILCPTPCPTAWPLGEIVGWSNLLIGLAAAGATALRLRAGRVSR